MNSDIAKRYQLKLNTYFEANEKLVNISLWAIKVEIEAVAPTARYIKVEDSDQGDGGLVWDDSTVYDANRQPIAVDPEVLLELDENTLCDCLTNLKDHRFIEDWPWLDLSAIKDDEDEDEDHLGDLTDVDMSAIFDSINGVEPEFDAIFDSIIGTGREVRLPRSSIHPDESVAMFLIEGTGNKQTRQQFAFMRFADALNTIAGSTGHVIAALPATGQVVASTDPADLP